VHKPMRMTTIVLRDLMAMLLISLKEETDEESKMSSAIVFRKEQRGTIHAFY